MKLKEVKHSTQILEKAFTALDDGIGILDRRAKFAYLNTAACQIFERQGKGTPRIGDDFFSFIHPDRKELYRNFINEAFNNQVSVFILNYPQNGKDTWYELSYRPVVNADGSVDYVCVKATDITEKKRLEEEKKELQNKILKATIAAQEKERSLIGRELHDNVNQVLTTVKLYTELCYHEEKPNKELLYKSLNQVNYCIEEIRNLSRRLAVPKTEDENFSKLIRELIDSINATRKTNIELITHGVKNLELNQELKTTVYRIVQEQLTNVLKYAHATEVKVTIAATKSVLAVEVQDNGMGFNLEEKKNSNGLTNMRSRTQLLGGTMHFETAPGRGCTLTAEFPL
jgi:PAS domain S-box-containing protein